MEFEEFAESDDGGDVTSGSGELEGVDYLREVEEVLLEIIYGLTQSLPTLTIARDFTQGI